VTAKNCGPNACFKYFWQKMKSWLIKDTDKNTRRCITDSWPGCGRPQTTYTTSKITEVRIFEVVWAVCGRRQPGHESVMPLLSFSEINVFNPLMGTGNYSATSYNMKLVHWPLMGGLLRLVVHSEEGTGRDHSPSRPLLAVPNVTAHPSTASVPITVLLCNFNVGIKGLIYQHHIFY